MSQQKSYFQILPTPEEFKEAEKKLLYQIKMDESELTPQKAKEHVSLISTMWDLKAVLKF
ncbi:hypothetical protein C8_450 [Cannes 8 virus]|uniref:Uncharacterized protein n=1 Tax=Marseillevirus marseillevirus TaxID=694581 RepID=D2XB60_GBMV|nr:hypothetical protein MAR_ORF425 [Marseillevirus marseillevirus]ADB04187.1 hypothetical protein MAR_ORF425 [Marseillevirus marseillevirus]AGV01799.1 hypothetical protein C8_450 [Cannes 8 virus]ANB78280.1 hypothetical protein MEL_378b [Melbournevirus]AVR53147.1 hypothetical protein MarSH_442 [Marseillevirus Shanghai 1]